MLIKNYKAYRDYKILAELEAGVALMGPEVKSLRAGQANLDGALIHLGDGGVFLVGAYIAPYPAAHETIDPRRNRRLLLNKGESLSWYNKMKQEKLTVLPLEWYNKDNLIKLKIGLARKKKIKGKKPVNSRNREFRVS
ncbi:MAG: SsrA-binding protein [Candidatus Shapirobacteria bacterium]|nr:SsrA-binding protein [Candidatus Shapirobacteria bacterium]MDD5481914.1 SsrA-binding protein [Candidatus Shapirobacteria bacterium]